MTKKNFLWAILELIFLIVFNIAFFMLGGTEHSLSAWISYGFIHFAYIMFLFTPLMVRKSSSAHIFGFSIGFISLIYFFLALIIGIIFILIDSDNYKVSLIVQIIIFGIYAVVLVSYLLANEATADSIQTHEKELEYIKTSSAKLKSILSLAKDKALRTKIEYAYDLIHASPVKSSNAVKAIEKDIINQLDNLANAATDNVNTAMTITQRIIKFAEERNAILRLKN